MTGLLFLKFIKDNWFIITLIISIGSTFLYIKHLQSTNEYLSSELHKEQSKLTRCNTQITSNNKAIQDWKIKSDLQEEHMSEVELELLQMNQKTQKQIINIVNHQSIKTCPEALQSLIKIGKKYEIH